MFFLITNLSIGKYYPNIMAQFIFGIVCYAIFFFIAKDFISNKTYETYKYYVMVLIVVDTSFLLYRYKYDSGKKSVETAYESTDTTTKFSNNETMTGETKTHLTTDADISFSSDIDDYRVFHDLSVENENDGPALPVSESETEVNTEKEPVSDVISADKTGSEKYENDLSSISFSVLGNS